MLCLLRFVLQIAGANFYSPFVNAVMRLTDPILKPLRKLLPKSNRVDLASLIVAVLLQCLIVYFQVLSAGSQINVPWWAIVWFGLIATLNLAVWIALIAILISVVMSWIAPNVYSPAAEIARQISEPLLAPIRKFLPPMAGFDFSPMVAMLILFLVLGSVIPFLQSIAG